MSSNNSSGVRNLRAMFENKASSDQSTSPPSRGRSPLENGVAENSRPVSKVRTSFVAVEKPGQPGQAPQLGLRKVSDVSSVSGLIGNTAGDLSRTPSRKITMTDQTLEGDLGTILKGSPFEDDKAAHVRQAKHLGQALASGQAQKKISENSKKEESADEALVAPTAQMKSPTSTTKTKPPTSQIDASKTVQPIKAPPTRQVPPTKSEKSPISPKAPQTAKVNSTHPVPHIRGIHGGPAKIMAVMDSAHKAQAEREKKVPVMEKKPSLPPKKSPAPKAPVTNGVKNVPTTPKPEKSTKPSATTTKLPAAVTAPTAASVARTDVPPKTLSTENRRTSAVRKDKPPPRVASTTTASSLAKRTPRNSLAPQTNGHERPKSRVSAAQDENFLARMMRPTASSQQKVHEKVTKPNSPPRARKVSDKVRQSLGSGKDKSEDKENEAELPLEATKSEPEQPAVEEQSAEIPVETAVAQEATS